MICHAEDLPHYAPPGHWGTRNVRLAEGKDTGSYEMILGHMTADGGSERHHHDENNQVMFILEGEALVELGSDPPRQCPAGSVIHIPPKLDHRITAGGRDPLRFIVVFSPQLEPPTEKR
jgi:quercetin dioxygenase-like cupin family protein